MLELIVAGLILIALILYALLGGADFGGGIWDLLAVGPRANKQRSAIAKAIGPIWEANHVWLIFVIVLLFSGFPAGFAAIMNALHIPLTAMLVGIVLRGATFVFRSYDLQTDAVHRRWSLIFGAASFFTPFVQGVILGALASGEIHVVEGHVTSGFFAGWQTPFALSCGVFAWALFAFLAAVYLTVETQKSPAIQADFRHRALVSGIALAPIAAVVFVLAQEGAPVFFAGLTRWWAPVLLVWTSIFALGALWALFKHRYALARIAAILQVASILTGWGLAQFPYLIVPDVTFLNTAAPAATLQMLVIITGFGAIVLIPSLACLFYLFKRTPIKL